MNIEYTQNENIWADSRVEFPVHLQRKWYACLAIFLHVFCGYARSYPVEWIRIHFSNRVILWPQCMWALKRTTNSMNVKILITLSHKFWWTKTRKSIPLAEELNPTSFKHFIYEIFWRSFAQCNTIYHNFAAFNRYLNEMKKIEFI